LRKGIEAYKKAKVEEAIAHLSETIRLDSTNAQAYYFRGLAHGLKVQDKKEELSDFNEAIRLNPNYAEAYRQRGWSHLMHSQTDKSLKDLSEALRIEAKDDKALWMRAYVYYEVKEYAKAKMDCEEAIRLNPKNPSAHSVLARILACCPEDKMRDGEIAVKNATKACELMSWKYPAYIDLLALAYAEAGQFEDAVKWEKKALEIAGEGLVAETEKKRFKGHLRSFEQRKPVRITSLRTGE
jgi:tetratricopeptide (TPR) repeat protein